MTNRHTTLSAFIATTLALGATAGCGGGDGEPASDAGPEAPDAAPAPPTPGYVRIEPGEFTMGSPANEPGNQGNETQHEVTLTRVFGLKATEVTQAEWQAVMGNNPSSFAECGDDCPVEGVSWYDAIDFCNALSAQQGLAPCYDGDRNFVGLDCEGYRLPTEAEWEYAARAGTETAFHTGGITNPGCEPLDPNLVLAG